MNMIKRIVFIITVLSILLSIFSCSEYKPPINNGGGKLPDGSAEQPELDDDPTNDFTVTLRLNEAPFIPTTAINVFWNDGYSVHVAPIDENGYATIDGLDGDYSVTLSAVPSGYAYDTNAYKATNYNKNIVIDLYDLNLVHGSGTGLYNCYNLSGTGVYSVTITEEDEGRSMVYFEFAPQLNGTYTIESWASVADDEINPVCMAYLGSSSYKYGEYRVTDVGVCGSFTRNFVHTIEIADEMISSGGSQTFTFALSAEAKSGVYPVTYTFAVKRNGGFDLGLAEKVMVKPTFDWTGFDFDAFNALAGGRIQTAETLYPGTTSSYIYDEDKYKIWSKSEGGDGVYHVYDPVKYSATGGYGPILVAYIKTPCKYIDKAFTEIEMVGNKALTVSSTENYKQFIEGYYAVASAGFYCVDDCPCHIGVPMGEARACPPGCTECTAFCTPCPEDLMNTKGYADYCNADGVAPVTEELAEFLQKFSISQRYFADGDGWAETTGVDAYEDSQWLFACGYYVD